MSKRLVSSARCILCAQITQKAYYQENREQLKESARNNYDLNRESRIKKVNEWRKSNSDKYLKWQRQYNQERRSNDPVVKARVKMKAFLSRTLKLGLQDKEGRKTIEILGYTPRELKEHIESLFTGEMDWDNYGWWHIDHRKPLVSFDLADPKQWKIANRLENLRPLWAWENLSKGSSIVGD
jgi:hypothetical protein